MASYSLDKDIETPFVVIDYFDECGREGVYEGSREDCQAFIAAQGDSFCIGMYDIVPNWRNN